MMIAYGLANADTPQGMRAQGLYRLLSDAKEFSLATGASAAAQSFAASESETPRASLYHLDTAAAPVADSP
jgi:hypothetical protein